MPTLTADSSPTSSLVCDYSKQVNRQHERILESRGLCVQFPPRDCEYNPNEHGTSRTPALGEYPFTAVSDCERRLPFAALRVAVWIGEHITEPDAISTLRRMRTDCTKRRRYERKRLVKPGGAQHLGKDGISRPLGDTGSIGSVAIGDGADATAVGGPALGDRGGPALGDRGMTTGGGHVVRDMRVEAEGGGGTFEVVVVVGGGKPGSVGKGERVPMPQRSSRLRGGHGGCYIYGQDTSQLVSDGYDQAINGLLEILLGILSRSSVRSHDIRLFARYDDCPSIRPL
ncbi:hypothetical protein C7212DRAFT_343074 [Tuber magnatum]|uniref:Uncharacterized protein n=1 Tax=Tuber magnatum TaxID=42249 RepID=A0A317STZ6_9PEZI|nr:hypothetical protein C7212DRAFT_343074 [Tuber magnatum]